MSVEYIYVLLDIVIYRITLKANLLITDMDVRV